MDPLGYSTYQEPFKNQVTRFVFCGHTSTNLAVLLSNENVIKLYINIYSKLSIYAKYTYYTDTQN